MSAESLQGEDPMNTLRRAWLAAALMLGLPAAAGAASPTEDPPTRHNMLVVGKERVFLSHLPMFEAVNPAGTDYTSRHRYQVILEVSFRGQDDITNVYLQDRDNHPEVKMYTLEPNLFTLSRLFPPAGQPALTSFKANVFRGHLERPGNEPIAGLRPAQVQVEKVIYAKKFDPSEAK